ncbi:hypothetical protein MRB53_008680 [Persea americana]|uniref:Uncharacterized protein n=1 Tax=Persea americana TaxID=3435 RepID=A0ACC2MMF0_PERAE|nr:hypothetical protein MRB53_008680 [Persea americana]|eukprot:TRINITY_DN7060_c4_g1_i1.p1 TRINITY_DN7060_c4_g1~~TRINITY_DN7060_c4_g1_i1.p1  ORF type:complete len:387 (-),score=53.37 TRINITY_DN7060_c4_g1_i1:103-1263(-)
MDRYEKKYQNPSFSANVLDAIYRSIDNGDIEAAEEMVFYSETMRKKQSFSSRMQSEKWVVERKKTTEKSDLGRTPATYFEHGFEKSHRNLKPTLSHSGSSSSDSSESEPVFVRPKPVRTGLQRKTQLPEIQAPKQQKPKQESFNKTKPTPSSSAKSHGGGVDLKKPKQPISPGGRIAGFLNSLFTAAGNAKKTTKLSSLERKSKSDRSSSSTCSSASSYSRSCLSKTPSSRGNSIKSVRFYPVSVIVDEDSRPCGQKHIYDREREMGHLTVGIKKSGECPPLIFGEELKRHLMEKNRQVEAAKDLLKGYQKKSKIIGEVMRDVHENAIYDEEEEDDFDDGMSCSSSDLFELDNLAVIGIDRYREELPVYETTRLDTNRAIASGLIR